jgi:superfamily II DNA or RNA helicase
MPDLFEEIIAVVREFPGLTGRQIAYHIRRNGYPNVTRRDVNQLLYSQNSPCYYTLSENGRPAWYLRNTMLDNQILELQENDELIWTNNLELYPWQLNALNEWQSNGYQGVIEAVTGAGKTRVAIAAIEAHLRINWRVVVLVPSIAIQAQWKKVLREYLIDRLGMNKEIGLLGGGNHDSLTASHILIAVAASAAKDPMINETYEGLLIADECHRYGADTWALALQEPFIRRLGLTATYERPDEGIEKYLDPYFKRICYTLGYEKAINENVIAKFKIAFISADLSNDERSSYEELNYRCSSLRRILTERHRVVQEPFGEFIKEVNMIASGGEGVVTGLARQYLNSFSKRRQLLASSVNKINSLACLVPAIHAAERTILFAQTKNAADNAVRVLTELNVQSAVLDATMNINEQNTVFAAFEEGEYELVAAPLLLDEGIDVPSADLAIVLASSRSRRQMIQRMGRVLRNKEDNRLARIVIIYLKDTSEDPDTGIHETFVNLIMDAATDFDIFDSNTDSKEICEFLNDMYL